MNFMGKRYVFSNISSVFFFILWGFFCLVLLKVDILDTLFNFYFLSYQYWYLGDHVPKFICICVYQELCGQGRHREESLTSMLLSGATVPKVPHVPKQGPSEMTKHSEPQWSCVEHFRQQPKYPPN